MHPKISVILPTFNAENFLKHSIDSILNQSESDFELLIIDDNSNDETLKIVSSFEDSRLKLFINQNRLGLAESLNKGILLSKGKYIARMDADDISLPHRFEHQIKLIEETNVDICGCHYVIIDCYDNIIGAQIVPTKYSDIILRIANEVPFAHGSVMIKKESLLSCNLNYTDNSFAEDYLLWCGMYNAGLKFANANEVLYKYRKHNDSISIIKYKNIKKESNSIRKKFIETNKDTLLVLIDNKLSFEITNVKDMIDLYVPGFYISFLKFNFIIFYKTIKKSTFKHFLLGFNRIIFFLS